MDVHVFIDPKQFKTVGFACFLSWPKNLKNKDVSEIAPDPPKRCSSIGRLWETCFRAGDLNIGRGTLGFPFVAIFGFRDFLSCFVLSRISCVVGHEY